jgi:glycosyltransferase involved in cell wall biosynthesis
MPKAREIPRVVISTVDPPPIWELPAAVVARGDAWLSGGQQTLHELAVAAAVAGYDVELRGEYSPALLQRLEAATGVRPATPNDQRRPLAHEIVVIGEGGWDPLRFARYVLSPARVVLGVFAPTGLFGWPFTGRPRHLDPSKVGESDVARPAHFRAIAALGVDVFTHMGRVHDLAAGEGVRTHFIGNGTPLAVPEPAEQKDIDVAYLEGSRWLDLAEQAVAMLGRPAHRIAVGSHAEVLEQIARAKVLVWPARVEGHGRVLWEARATGTVVVALSSNVYATGLEEAAGAIALDSLEQMPAVVERLLTDDSWREQLSRAGRRTALEQVSWRRYVARVDAAIARVNEREEDPQADAFAWFGRRIGELISGGDT